MTITIGPETPVEGEEQLVFGDFTNEVMRRCRVCGETKQLLTEFGLRTNGRRRTLCRACEKRRAQDYYRANREKMNLRTSAYMKGLPKHVLRKYRHKSRYGITETAYEVMLERQEGCCAICGKREVKRLVIDHCHTTGRVRGLLCDDCNLGISRFGEDPAIFQRALDYLAANV